MKVNSKSITTLLIAFGLSLSLVGCNSTVEDNAELKVQNYCQLVKRKEKIRKAECGMEGGTPAHDCKIVGSDALVAPW